MGLSGLYPVGFMEITSGGPWDLVKLSRLSPQADGPRTSTRFLSEQRESVESMIDLHSSTKLGVRERPTAEFRRSECIGFLFQAVAGYKRC